jgi:hypothetical protein
MPKIARQYSALQKAQAARQPSKQLRDQKFF